MSKNVEVGGETGIPASPPPCETVNDGILTAQGLAEVYGLNRQRLAAVVARRGTTYAYYDGEDALQDAVLSTLRRAQEPGVDIRANSVVGYLAVAATRNLINRHRVLASRVHHQDIDEIGNYEPELSTEGPDPLEDMNFASTWEQVRQHLNPEQQKVILLTAGYGFTPTDAAKILGIPLGTVKSRRHYALKALRKAVEDKTLIVS